jgi:hypothetical protein
MNYGIGNGGGFGVSIPLNGYSAIQSFTPYQTQGLSNPQGGSWVQPTIGYSQPSYGQQSAGLGYGQPINQGWPTIQSPEWSRQTYLPPQQTYYQPPQQYGFNSLPLRPGCGNCGHTKPVIRRDW